LAFPQAASAGVALVLIVVILGVGAVLLVPYSPSISGTFVIQANPTNPSQLTIFLTSGSYSKQPIIRGYFANGTLSLPITPATSGPYTVTITISYNGNTLASRTYLNAALGTYGFQIAWFTRQETTGVPYVITVGVSGLGIMTPPVSFAIYPS
jgi:hypothetical protein